MIGRVIESYARRFGYGVVREFTGHGIGTAFHSGLIIPHYDEPRFDDEILPGMTFTIEPMLNLGTHEWVMWDDGWTVVTADGRRSAQFEHTLLVTADGAEVLTHPRAFRPRPRPADGGFRRARVPWIVQAVTHGVEPGVGRHVAQLRALQNLHSGLVDPPHPVASVRNGPPPPREGRRPPDIRRGHR